LPEQLWLDDLFVFEQMGFLWRKAEAVDQKIAEITGIIHASLQRGAGVVVDATENGFACHGVYGDER
jgi:hypothetical protein